MGCIFEVLFPTGTLDALASAEIPLCTVDRLDEVLSIYKQDSEVSAVNRSAGLGVRPISPDLQDILEQSIRLTDETEGAFDVCSGALIQAWGFDSRERRVPDPDSIKDALLRCGPKMLQMDPTNRTAAIVSPGASLNFGAIGKGYALDAAMRELLKGRELEAALLHGGTSSVLALGCPPHKTSWQVGLLDPWNEENRIAFLNVRDCGLGTSGGAHRFFEAEGKRWGHILDPRTGYPAQGPVSVTVVAPTAAEADALATAFFILGIEKAAEYVKSHPETGAVFFPETAGVFRAVLIGKIEPEFRPDVKVERIL